MEAISPRRPPGALSDTDQEQRLSKYHYLSHSMPGVGVYGTQKACFETDPTSVGDGGEGRSTSMSCLIVLAFRVPLGCQTCRPFLGGCSFLWDRIALYPFFGLLKPAEVP